METKSSNVLVGGVVLALVVSLFSFILWLANFDTKGRNEFDILFKQSVTGLAKGSQVQFSGVPVGAVDEIGLLPDTPEFVRVRIHVDENVPILVGTTATISGIGFTGVSFIQLDGAIKGASPISDPGPYGVPVIPTKPGALGELLSTAPELIARLSTLTLRLSEVLNDRNQASITGILKNSEQVTRAFAGRADEIAATLAEARVAVRELGVAATKFAALADSGSKLIDEDGRPLIADLRAATQRANATLAALEGVAKDAQPVMQTVNQQTLPEIGQLIRELRDVTTNLGAISAKLDEDPAGALVGGRKLPDYDPKSN
jgi:phospholipid/cholesterol/gamma-HCH transport system substrate-binding protein